MGITLVAAVGPGGAIGAGGGLPWHLPADLRRFKRLTVGHALVMGRRTYDSIGRPLPGRRTIVLTRDPEWTAAGVEVAHTLADALDRARAGRPDATVMVVGGGEVYRQALPLADRLEITEVDREVAVDTYFPGIDPQEWREVARVPHPGYSFVSYVRAGPIRDLPRLLAAMDPDLSPETFLFCAVPVGAVPDVAGSAAGWGDLHPVVTVDEPEGRTVVVPEEQARAAGLIGTFRCRRITLRVRSDLAAVGLTAAAAGALAADGIPANVVAGYHHDHVFVPADRADAAMAALQALSHTRP